MTLTFPTVCRFCGSTIAVYPTNTHFCKTACSSAYNDKWRSKVRGLSAGPVGLLPKTTRNQL